MSYYICERENFTGCFICPWKSWAVNADHRATIVQGQCSGIPCTQELLASEQLHLLHSLGEMPGGMWQVDLKEIRVDIIAWRLGEHRRLSAGCIHK